MKIRDQYSFYIARDSYVAELGPVSNHIEPQGDRFSVRVDSDLVHFSSGIVSRFIRSRNSIMLPPVGVRDIDVAHELVQDWVVRSIRPSQLPLVMASGIAAAGLNGQDDRVSVSTERWSPTEALRVSVRPRSGEPICLSIPIVRRKGAHRALLMTKSSKEGKR